VNGKRHRVGVIGTSWWAELTHLPGLRARGDVDLVALCGRNAARLAEVADRHGVPGRFTDWRALLAAGGLDVLVVSTPNVLHHPQVMAALDAGLHVVCEKPLALDLAQARALAARADAAGRSTLTFFTHRAVGAAAHVKRLVAAGFLGRPLHASAQYLTASHLDPAKPAAWRMRRAEAGTGVLGDLGSHLVDLVRWWLGDVGRVSAQWQALGPTRGGVAVDADDAVAFLAELTSGVQVTFQASKLVAGRGNSQRVELYGTEGSLVYEADTGHTGTWAGTLLGGRAGRAGLEPLRLPPELAGGLEGADERAGRDEAYRRLTDPFFAAIERGGGAVSPDFHDGAAVQAVLDAVATSAEAGRWIDVPPAR
jgi:predicted dehydrogenase